MSSAAPWAGRFPESPTDPQRGDRRPCGGRRARAGREPGRALLRLRDRRSGAGRASPPTGSRRRGTRTRGCMCAGRRRRSSRRSRAPGRPSCSGCRRGSRSASSPAARWRTSRRSPPPATPSSHGAGWDVNERGLHRRTGDPRRGRRRAARDDRPRGYGSSGSAPHCDRSGGGRRRRAGWFPTRWEKRSRELDGPTIVCAQAGNVNTGSFDPLDEIADIAAAGGRLAARRRRLRSVGRRRARPCATWSRGAERADSWATDAHKWLNVPYDSGIAFCAAPRGAPGRDERSRELPDPCRRPTAHATRSIGTPSSRVARAASPSTPRFARSARSGVAELVERCCAHARRFGEALGRDARDRGAQRGRAEPGARSLPRPEPATTTRTRER